MTRKNENNRKNIPTRRRVTRYFRLDRRALSSVITMAGIMSIILMVIAAILNTLVPQWAKEDEASHMDDELRSYQELRTGINNMIDHSDFEISISPRFKLGATGNIPVGVIPSSGKLSFVPLLNTTDSKASRQNDTLSIYSKGGGFIEYKATNYYYEDQTIVYEHGAVLVSQAAGAAAMKSGPDFNVRKSPLLNASATYGYFDPGPKEEPSEKAFAFGGRYGNLTLTYEAYDIDTKGEVLIRVNRNTVATVELTPNKSWKGPITFNISSTFINDFTDNVLEFNQTSLTGTEEWGIRNITLTGNNTDVALTMISLIGNKEDVGGRDSHTIQASLVAQELNSYYWPMETISLNFSTRNPAAWEHYFNTYLNSSETGLRWSPDRAQTDFYLTTVTLQNPNGGTASNEYYIISLVIKDVNNFHCNIAIIRINIS